MDASGANCAKETHRNPELPCDLHRFDELDVFRLGERSLEATAYQAHRVSGSAEAIHLMPSGHADSGSSHPLGETVEDFHDAPPLGLSRASHTPTPVEADPNGG